MPRFLIDNQLPLTLARHLASQGIDAIHVRDRGLGQASDDVIAALAVAESLVIISKDEDFVLLSDLRGAPQIVWVRMGNCRNMDLIEAFDRCMPNILASVALGQRIIQIV